jgi:hypothetical protein
LLPQHGKPARGCPGTRVGARARVLGALFWSLLACLAASCGGDDDDEKSSGNRGGETTQTMRLCSNTCGSAFDDECDDGGPGADFDVCSLGTDCADCGITEL